MVIEKDKERLRASFKKNDIMGPLSLDRFFPEMRLAHLVAVTEKRTSVDWEKLAKAVEEA